MYHIKDDKRSIQSSKFIYDGLSKLMIDKGFDDITITELVKVSHVSRATFYRNFDSKIDVLIFICDKTFDGMISYFTDYNKKHKLVRSSEFMIPFLKYFDKNTLIVELLLKANRQDVLSNSLKKAFDNFRTQFYLVAENPNETWDYFVAIRIGITISILIQWIQNGKNLTPIELGNMLNTQLKNSFTVDTFM